MQTTVNNGELTTVFDVAEFNVNVGDSARIDVNEAVSYIKTGQAEVQEVVDAGTVAFNQNAQQKTEAFNTNASEKTTAFNNNATSKTNTFNSNATSKTTAFNDNASSKTSDFNTNATNKTNAFNQNATDKTTAFNDNYTEKKAIIDSQVDLAKDWATKTDGTVDGTDYSAKYYAQSILPIASDITTVASISSDVTTVSSISTDVTAVANNNADVSTVADSIADVNSVATDILKVTAVADDLTNIDAVNANKTNIDTVAGISSDVSTVSGISTDVTSVASNNTDISAVASDISNVNAVAGDLTNIDTVAGNTSDISTVAGISSEVSTVAGISSDILAVESNATDISDVAEIKDEVTAVAQDKENVDAVAENITNVNTVAGDHANIQTVVNNMTAINNAPTYANNSKIWAEGLDGEVAPLGGTHSSKGWAEIAEQAASGVQNPANRDLSNLTNTGQMIIDSVNGTISNCILEIPQNLKLELSGNTMTVKSGSILTDSGSTYQTITLTADKTLEISNTPNQRTVIFSTTSGTLAQVVGVGCVSGSTDSLAGTAYHIWFDTSNKEVNYYGSDGTTPLHRTYPLCVIDVDENGVAHFAKDSKGRDMIFNGAGFIGHHIFVYPGVKVLISDGTDTNGGLKSYESKTNSLIIAEIPSYLHKIAYLDNNANFVGVLRGYEEYEYKTDIASPQSFLLYYIKKENTAYVYSGGFIKVNRKKIIDFIYDGTTITDFSIVQPVRLATTEMLDKVQSQVDTKQADVTTLTGYDSTQTQTLKNINGVLTWVTD